MTRAIEILSGVPVEAIKQAFDAAYGTNAEAPLHLLYLIRCNPDLGINQACEQLGIPRRTGARWLRYLKEEGFNKYKNRAWRRSSSQAPSVDLSHVERSKTSSTSDALSTGALLRWISRAPTAVDTQEWGLEAKNWIGEILKGVDHIGINISTTVNLFPSDDNGDTDDTVVYSEVDNRGESGEIESSSVHLGKSRGCVQWKMMVSTAREANMLDLAAFSPPVGQDYYYTYGGYTEYIGSIVLLRKIENGPLPRETQDVFRAIAPVITMVFAGTVARMKAYRPEPQPFRSVLSRIDGAERLTAREEELMLLHIVGHAYEEIASILNISISTVKAHTASILSKLAVSSIKEVIAKVATPRVSYTDSTPPEG